MSTLKEAILAGEEEHGSIPFWSWNDRLEEGELRRQIRNMKSLGMHGFFMHARGGLETEYLSDDWFRAVGVCIDEAKKLGMEAWSYDENGWPSGFAGGILLKDPKNLAAFLIAETGKAYPENPENVVAVFRKDGDALRRVNAPCTDRDLIVIRKGYDESYVDTLNPEVTKKFLSATHEAYRERIPADVFGSVMPGFFTDEPQYYRWNTPYSDTLPAVFSEKYGYSLEDGIAALFFDYPGAEEFRYDYYRLIHELFTQNFIRVICEWCGENGVQITGHAVEESSLSGQMMCCGGVMPFYEYEHIPGIDYLGRGIANALAPKQLGSVCAQLGKKKALSEMFACCGWDVTPRELKRIAEMQYANGVNVMCQHLYSYSIRGQRKRDYPCHYSDHNPWQEYLGAFDTYFNRLGAALSLGEEAAEILVLHPMHSAYLHYMRFQDHLGRLEGSLDRLVRTLTEYQIPYHFGDECLMAKYATTDHGTVTVGKMKYRMILIPECDTIDRGTAELLRKYLKDGGKLCAFGKLPERIDGKKADLAFLQPNCTFDDLVSSCPLSVRGPDGKPRPIHSMIRKTEEGRIVFLANPSGNEYRDLRVELKNCRSLCSLDLNTMEYRPIRGKSNPDGSFSALIDLGDSASVLLAEREFSLLPYAEGAKRECLRLENTVEFVTRPENMIVLDYADYRLGGGAWKDRIAVMGIKDTLLSERYRGEVTLRYTYVMETVPEKLLLVGEPMKYRSVRINGKDAALTDEKRLDRSFLCWDAAPLTVKGNNTVEMTFDYAQRDYVYYVLYGGVSESLRNCLSFDTEIEPVYLFGLFRTVCDSGFVPTDRNAVLYDGSFRLAEQKDTVDLNDPLKDGYPFFTGRMKVRSVLNWHDGMPTLLNLGGRFAVAELTVNGTPLWARLFDDTFDLTGLLTEGENAVELTLCNSRRNLLGPHHFPDPEPYGVGPNVFSCEKQWKDGKCASYPDRYSFVRFGINF